MRSILLLFLVSVVLSPSVLGAMTPMQSFGTGVSQGWLNETEEIFFSYTLTSGAIIGTMSHFWITGAPELVDTSIWSYYIDGESTPSVQFQPALACGTGFQDETAPWANKWFGKQAKTGGWYHNIRIPFNSSITITGRAAPGVSAGGFYVIFRGTENLPLVLGGTTLPWNAKLSLQTIDHVLHQPLDFVTIAAASQGYAGALFLHTLVVESGNMNFLEGCYHSYTATDTQFPGSIVSTGTEDYYDSAFYFDAGQFRGDISGETHITTVDNMINFSAYRIHDTDPIFFRDGFRFDWRVGDVTNPATGRKCTDLTGVPNGTPQPSNVTSYAWVYSWPIETEHATPIILQ